MEPLVSNDLLIHRGHSRSYGQADLSVASIQSGHSSQLTSRGRPSSFLDYQQANKYSLLLSIYLPVSVISDQL